MRNKLLIKLIISFIFLSSCKSNKLDIDVSNIDLEIRVKRMDKDLFESPATSVIQNLPKIETSYGSFFTRFATIINIGNPKDPNFSNALTGFLEDATIKEVYKKSAKAYPDFSIYEKQLTEAFKHYNYYFPEKKIPEIVTYISGFNYALIAEDSLLGIGLDMYLGKDCEYYTMLAYPKYKVQNMNNYNIVPDALKAWLSTEFEPENDKGELLTDMIYYGKLMYMMDAFFPTMHDSLKISYSQQQLEWCNANESNIWKHFVEKKLFYSTDYSENTKYLGEAPFTSGLPRESPSRVGIWLGWKIVRAYMENNPNVSISKLMNEKDAQKILNQSKYKPKR